MPAACRGEKKRRCWRSEQKYRGVPVRAETYEARAKLKLSIISAEIVVEMWRHLKKAMTAGEIESNGLQMVEKAGMSAIYYARHVSHLTAAADNQRHLIIRVSDQMRVSSTSIAVMSESSPGRRRECRAACLAFTVLVRHFML